jgi:hypothetical protein
VVVEEGDGEAKVVSLNILELGPTGATEVGPVVVSRGLFGAVVKLLSAEETGVVGLDVLSEGVPEVKLDRASSRKVSVTARRLRHKESLPEDDVLYVMLGW